jgi:hypothetical protein
MIDFHFQSRLPVLVIFCRGCHPATSAFAFAFGIIGGTGVSDMKKVKPSQIAAKIVSEGLKRLVIPVVASVES